MELPVWAQGGIAGLTLAAMVYIFLGMRNLFREFMRWTSNHLHEITDTQSATAAALTLVSETLRDLKDEVVEMRRSVDRHTYTH